MSPWALWLCVILFIGTGIAVDVPFVFDDTSANVASYTSAQLEQAYTSSPELSGVPSVSTPSDNEVIAFPVTGGGSTPGRTTEKNVGELKKALDARVEPNNPRVRDEAVVLALRYPGEKTIEQVVSIYDYLKNGDGSRKGWGYVSDPRGIDDFMFANQTLKNGERANCVGGGDCDDFAILMAALVESIGGTTRIILARNNTIGGHAYTEVYLGNLDAQNSQVENIIIWLKEKFDTDKIFTHIDTDTKDVWLNLDWGPDEKGNTRPGGPFYQGDKHDVICIRDTFVKTPLKLPEISNKLPKLISLTSDNPSSQDIGTSIVWTAEAKDPEDDQILYRFFLNDEAVTKWIKEDKWTWTTTDYDIGENQIAVRVRDGMHAGPDGFDSNQEVIFEITKPKSKPTVPVVSQTRSKVEAIFPDQNLEAAIRVAINKPKGTIYTEDLYGLNRLEANNSDIKDIAGLEYCDNLTYLDLSDNQITDVSPLSGLTSLTVLYLSSNQITDVSPLSGLTSLTDLLLSGNHITDVSPLSGLTSLTDLFLYGSDITDVSPLSGLTSLTVLYLSSNQITDVSPLSGLTSLTDLYLSSNPITDVSPLSGLTSLTYLDLKGNQITDVSSLSGLTSLRTLDLSYDHITDVSPLSGLTSLTYLYLYNNQITDVSPLSGLTSLTDLRLSNNQITDVSPLSGLTSLRTLELDNNQITDVSPLSGLTSLEDLDLSDNQITDVSTLSGLTSLTDLYLYLYNNQITDVSPLSGLTNVKIAR
jgi:Leucine-rich repeat (LRR) protein